MGGKIDLADLRKGMVAVLIMCALLVIAAFAFDGWSGKSNLPAGAISARDLYRAYGANEVAANQAYAGKRITVYGKVGSIDTFLGNAFVTLKTSWLGGDRVQCGFFKNQAPSLASLNKGDSVTIVGECRGKSWIAGVQLIDCKIVR